MSFWKKLFGVKESPKADVAESDSTEPSATSNPQRPSILDAVRAGDTAKVRALLEEDPDLAFSEDTVGLTPLHCDGRLQGRGGIAARQQGRCGCQAQRRRYALAPCGAEWLRGRSEVVARARRAPMNLTPNSRQSHKGPFVQQARFIVLKLFGIIA